MNSLQIIWILGIKCKRCGGIWTPKKWDITADPTAPLQKVNLSGMECPRVCAKCRSPYYDKERNKIKPKE